MTMADPPYTCWRATPITLQIVTLSTLLFHAASAASIADMEVREAVGCSWGHLRLWCPDPKKIGVVSAGVLVLPGNWSTSACPIPFLPPSSPLPPLTAPYPSPSPPIRLPRLPLPLPFPITMAGLTLAKPRYHIRHPVNYRCSGRSTCNFNLKEDYPASHNWSPGVVIIRYVCMGDELVRYCNEEIEAGEGFLSNPTYPRYYQGQRECWWRIRSPTGGRIVLTLLDLSIRGVATGESGCVDTLSVREGTRTLFSGCGDLGAPEGRINKDGYHSKGDTGTWTLESEGSSVEVVLSAKSTFLYPKRGVLMHFRAIAGCPTPPSPVDGYLVSRNETHAQFMCCVDHVFPDTLQRTRLLACYDTWNDTVPDCVREDQVIAKGFGLGAAGINASSTAATQQEDGPYYVIWRSNNTSDHEPTLLQVSPIDHNVVFTDVILPSAIMAVLFFINAVILLVIFHLRRKGSQQSQTPEATLVPPPHFHHNHRTANGGNNGTV